MVEEWLLVTNNRNAELACELVRAKELKFAVVSVNYRLAPENQDPAPVEDCYAGLVWLFENAHKYKLNPKQIIVKSILEFTRLTIENLIYTDYP